MTAPCIPNSLVEDVPVRFKDWLPRNFDRDHQGAVTVRRALQQSLNVPAVLALEKVGAAALPRHPARGRRLAWPAARRQRRLTRHSARQRHHLAAGDGRALLGPGQRRRSSRRLCVRRDQPKPTPVRLVGPAAAWYVSDILADAPLPEGFASLPVALRERRIAYKTGTSAGFRDAWAAGYSANWTVVVWVGHADGTPRPGPARPPRRPACSSSRPSAACPARTIAPQRPPADVLRVASNRDLPLRMRTLGPAAMAEGGPRIAYPPPDARIELAAARGRAAQRQWRQRPTALAGRRQADRRHAMDARRPGHGARRRDRRPGPLERRDGAHRHRQ